MVIAEVPLWVHHPSNPGNETAANTSKAHSSLSLLQEKQKRCAIYAVDLSAHSDRFATAGGDGLVKIWSSASLFQGKGGRFEDDATYVSTSAGEDGDESGAEDADEKDAEDSKIKASLRATKADTTNTAASNVNDLSGLVRRKRGGVAVASPPRKPAPRPNHAPSQGSPKLASPPKSVPVSDRLLATLSSHSGSSVLAVRFSNNGKYLASAGDDGCVCVYGLSQQPTYATGFGSNDQSQNVEHWNRIRLCRGHNLDAVGLAWAPDDQHLVSCSLDKENPIIAWKMNDLDQPNAPKIASPMRVLGKDEHTSTVKGVTFDPAGSFLASSGDDPALLIWRAHDDWGLEKRIDASSGIFRQWQAKADGDSQSLFRRVSWSTDGSFLLSTNAMVRNKHVASTISREGWAVSGSGASTAADLVGHKHPVVACRHAPRLLDARQDGDMKVGDEDNIPEYATLMAIGDKRGFVTVWSTRKSRPLFKLQCGESRWAVTDLAWGSVPKSDDLMLLVSLVEGTVVALRFGVPDELGRLLSFKDQSRVFQLRYGIDVDDTGGLNRSFVGGGAGADLIESALHFHLENDQAKEDGKSDDESMEENSGATGNNKDGSSNPLSPSAAQTRRKETTAAGGKKRVAPLLVNTDVVRKKTKSTPSKSIPKATDDPIKTATTAASRVDALVSQQEQAAAASAPSPPKPSEAETTELASPPHNRSHHHRLHAHAVSSFVIPCRTDKRLVADLPLAVGSGDSSAPLPQLECINTTKKPLRSRGLAVPCVSVVLSIEGKKTWEDEFPGTSCTALSAAGQFAAVGTLDGTVQLYSTSPTVGWACGRMFRSAPAMIFGQAIVSLQVTQAKDVDNLTMMVVTADGSFGVYSLLPELRVVFKGSVLPAFTHMSLGGIDKRRMPSLSRIQMTDKGTIFLLLSFKGSQKHGNVSSASHTAGGSIQGFVYQRASELWIKASDSRFVLSDFFFSASFRRSRASNSGALSSFDEAVRLGSVNSSLKLINGTSALGSSSGVGTAGDGENLVCTRAHCEDRLACSVALGSADDFRYWMGLYARVLSAAGEQDMLRVLVDMLLGTEEPTSELPEKSPCWWMSSASTILGIDRAQLVRSAVLPEISKNQSLQRLLNEIQLQIRT